MDDHSAFVEAIRSGSERDCLARLRADHSLAGARDSSGVSALMTALYFGRSKLAPAIVRLHAGIDLFEAAALGELAVVDALTNDSAAASPAYSGDGFTALHFAAFFSHPEVAALLLARGHALEAVAANPMSVRPLHSAAAAPSDRAATVVALLLAAGAEVNARQHGGFTALHAAANRGDTAMIRLLIAHGADVEARTDDGKSAWDIARAKGHAGAAALLRDSVR